MTNEIEKLTKEGLDSKRELSCVVSLKAKDDRKKTALKSKIKTQARTLRNKPAHADTLEKTATYSSWGLQDLARK